ncbi:MAG: hypothetical protein M1816_001326 [Peltula sp. TS41687]|nr:MAG: hypothetical protein M1816_001326 [Peltula sp. TS41687]
MAPKRKLSSRIRKEVAPKSRKTTPKKESQPPQSAKDTLPTKLEDEQPLPTLTESDLKKFGVLAASLLRSRNKWLTECIFERYWVKPSKKKTASDLRNPPKENMVRIGPCYMIIEPHVFEIVLYAVKEPQAQVSVPPRSQLAQTSRGPSSQSNEPLDRTPSSYQNPSSAVRTNTDWATTPNPQTTSNSIMPNPQPLLPAPTSQGPGQASSEQYRSIPSQPPVAPNPSTDPVIQLLANRAATDYRLRDLMQVVASGNASEEELKGFQDHINDITASLRRKNELAAPQAGSPWASGGIPGAQPIAPAPNGNATYPANHGYLRPDGRSESNSGASCQVTPTPRTSVMNSDPYSANHNVARTQVPIARKEASPMSGRPETIAVVFEFTAGSGDRFLFPKHSILEFPTDGTMVIASFLVVRKGTDSDSGTYDSNVEYHQPVTIRISASSAKILEPLIKVVASPADTRTYMNEVMDRTTRAENAHLAIRLPRDSESANEGTD